MKAQIATRIIGIALPIAVATSFLAPAERADALTPNQTSPQGVVQALNADINYFWWWTFDHYDWNYSAPTKYAYYNGAGYPTQVQMGGCGVTSTNNSYYCPVDRAIYFDINYNQSLIRHYGDFGSAFVLIHEWSHHIDTIRPGNWFVWAAQNKRFAARELHADCLSGIYMRYLAGAGKLAAGDLSEALAWIDGTSEPAGYAPSNSDAHGTAAQRRAWFLAGYNNYSVGTCDSVFRFV